MTFFSSEMEFSSFQLVTPEQLAQVEPLVYEDYLPLAVYEYTSNSGHNFSPGKSLLGYVFIGRGQNLGATRYYAWAQEMTKRLFRTGANPILSMAFAYRGPAYNYRVCLAAQYYGGQYQLR
jgi:hypothetical protein